MDPAIYQARRRELAHRIGRGVAFVATAPERIRNRDTHHPFRFDSHFYYLTGFPEPEAVVALVCAGDGSAPRSILFCRERNAEREIWDGRRHGPEAAREAFGFDAAHAIGALDDEAPKLIADQPLLAVAIGDDAGWDARVMRWLNAVRAQSRAGVVAPSTVIEVRAPLDEMRLVKRAEEIDTMRRAARISAGAHRRAMRAAAPGRHEHEIEAELLHEFRRHGAQAPAYTPIVAGGANACVLHYIENSAPLADGELLLIDAGCELDGYAADITRTFPVNGRYGAAQRDVYELVLAAQAAALERVRPGSDWNAPHEAALRVLTRGLVDLGLLAGEVDGLIEQGAYRRYYMHRTGHWLGLDVHDAGEYKVDGRWREFVPGMVTTVEPGCYIRPADDVPRALWNIGVRIEDDVLVTPDGHEVLSADAPKSVADIEALMRAARD